MSIIVKNLTYIYDEGMPFASKAIDDISFEIKDRDFVGLIGHTGSGKSTLIQHLNGLIKPSSGEIFINDFNITGQNQNLTEIRKRVGIVFQYPEYQLFEETVEKDIAFGPSNLNLSQEEIFIRVKESMRAVGLDYDEYKDKSPFDLSGGQKRRVAIAGVIAMNPELLILDEPTVGVDTQSRNQIFNFVKKISKEQGTTVIYTSHYIEEVENLCSKVYIIDEGKEVAFGDNVYLKSLVSSNSVLDLELKNITKTLIEELLQTKGIVSLKENTGYSLSFMIDKNFELTSALKIIANNDSGIIKISYNEPSLEDVFLNLTGKKFKTQEQE